MSRRRGWGLHTLVVGLVVLASLVGGPVAGTAAADAAMQVSGVDGPSHVQPRESSPVVADHGEEAAPATINVRYEVNLANDSRAVLVTATAHPLDTVTELQPDLPESATIVSSGDFRRTSEDIKGDLIWTDDSNVETPSLTYRVSGPRPSEYEVFENDRLVSNGWAFLDPTIGWFWFYSDESPEFTESISLASNVNGVGGVRGAFIARNATTTRWSAGGQSFVLAQSERADIPAGQEAVIASLSDAAESLEIGGSGDTAKIGVPPTAYCGEPLCYSGQTYTSTSYVSSAAPVNKTDSTWVHEYIHTRQEYQVTNRTEWTIEAAAEYYGSLLPLQQGRTTSNEFFAFWSVRDDEDLTGTLTEPNTWSSPDLPYERGGKLIAALDVRIRAASNSEHTFQDVFRDMNADTDQLTYDEFRSLVAEYGNSSVATFLDRYATRDATPPLAETPYAYTSGPEADDDGDGLTTTAELRLNVSPFDADTDGDGLEDGAEADAGADPTVRDTDDDGLDDAREVALGTDPAAKDTDGDGLDDPFEVGVVDSDPTVVDTDDDGLEDGAEVDAGADPTRPDTDGDGLTDSREVEVGTDPAEADTDGDGLADDRELELGTDPTVADTDGDGVGDGAEVDAGTDLVDPSERPEEVATDGQSGEDAESSPGATSPTGVTTVVGVVLLVVLGYGLVARRY